MILNYTVTSAVEVEIAVRATVAGREVDAKMPGVAIEMVSDDESMGHTFRFSPDDPAACLKRFAPGTVVRATFEVAKAAPAAKPAKRR